MIVRVLFFILIVVIAVVAPTAVLAVCALAYALRYTAYELIFVAAGIDAFYGAGGILTVPYYILITSAVLILIEWVKPYISVYNQ